MSNDLFDIINEQKKRIEETLSRGGGGRSDITFWRPANGDNHIRIMPSWTSTSKQFWREVAQHWGVSTEFKGPLLCPKKTPTLSGDCPICEFVDELKDRKADVEAQKAVKDLRAKTAYLVNVVDLKDTEYTAQDLAEWVESNPDREAPFEVGDPKVQVYACPVSLFEQILGMMQTNKDDITRLDLGRNLRVKKVANKDPRKVRYELYPDFKDSKSSVPENHPLPDLTQVGIQFDREKMLDMLHSGVGSKHLASLPDETPAPSKRITSTASKGDLEAEMQNALKS